MQTEIMKQYIFYQVVVIMLYSPFLQSNFILFLSPILAYHTLMILAKLIKRAIFQVTA